MKMFKPRRLTFSASDRSIRTLTNQKGENMAVDRSKNNPSIQRKSNPTDPGSDKAQIKSMEDSKTDLGYKEQLYENYMEGPDEPDRHLMKHKNRNTNKVDLDKGRYN